MSFQQFGFSTTILNNLAREGYANPTPIQAEAIPPIMEGKDVLGCAQTGTGKSAAFALPLIHRLTHGGNPPKGGGRKIRVLVLTPTRELAGQIEQSFAVYSSGTSLRTLAIFGGVNQRRQTQALAHGVDILVATPGRLLDLIQQGFVKLERVNSLVLDEADRMLDMGFLPDIRRIIKLLPTDRQSLLFSATIPKEIEVLCHEILRDPTRIRLTPEQPTTALIEQSVHYVPQSKKSELLSQLLRQPELARVIVFTRTKHAADRVSRHLNKRGITSDAIHGNKTQSNRQRALDNFRNDTTQVLVATDVAARGIDIDSVTHVINFDLPHDPETYVHRIGRTGRANSTGSAISFCSSDERGHLRQIERLLKAKIEAASAVEGLESPDVTVESEADDVQEERSHSRTPRKPASRGRTRPPKFGERKVSGKPSRNREQEGSREQPRSGESSGTSQKPRRFGKKKRFQPGKTGDRPRQQEAEFSAKTSDSRRPHSSGAPKKGLSGAKRRKLRAQTRKPVPQST